MSTKGSSRGSSPDLYDERNNVPKENKSTKESITAGEWYNQCLNVKTPPGGWFSLRDCAWRYFLSLVIFYWSCITTPISFAYYTYKFN